MKKISQMIFNHRLRNYAEGLIMSRCECEDVPHRNDCEWFNNHRDLEILCSDYPLRLVNLVDAYRKAEILAAEIRDTNDPI